MQIRCPKCDAALARHQAGRLKLRLGLIVFRKSDDGGCVCETVCPVCGADAALPLQLADERLVKSLAPPSPTPPAGLRLVLRAQPS